MILFNMKININAFYYDVGIDIHWVRYWTLESYKTVTE